MPLISKRPTCSHSQRSETLGDGSWGTLACRRGAEGGIPD